MTTTTTSRTSTTKTATRIDRTHARHPGKPAGLVRDDAVSGKLVGSGPEGLHLFLEAELLALELLQSDGVRGRSAGFVLDRLVEGLVAGAQFTNAGVDGHDSSSPSKEWMDQ